MVLDNTGFDQLCCDELYRGFYVHFAVGSEARDEDCGACAVGFCCGGNSVMVGRAFRMKLEERTGL